MRVRAAPGAPDILGTTTCTATPTLTALATSTPQTLTFTPQDDASIHSDTTGTNYGSCTTINVYNHPVQHFLIKFQVEGLNGSPVTGAKLKLYNANDSTVGGQFYQVTNQTWTEESVTWNNAHSAESTLIALLGAVEPGNGYEVDVSSLITGDGTYSLRVSSTSGNGADYSSKEGAHAPVLEVTTGSDATATPSPTDT